MEIERTGGKIGGVIGIEQPAIVFLRIALWQEERFGGKSVFIYRREIDTGVEPVVATTGEEKPSAVGRPVVQALRTRTVHFVQGACLACL